MKLDMQDNVSENELGKPSTSLRRSLGMLLGSWEVYLILLVAAFLRLYHINTTEFDGDQADFFYMAHNAVSHGHLVATSNVASIRIFSPPAIIYALMVPSAFSANPMWGAVLTALLAIASVLLTYFLTRQYYGRLAAILATSLYATASASVFYSRFIWNPNMLLLFVPLLIWFLFRGVVARRNFWLFPSVVLVGLLVQFHGSCIVLVAPLLVALVLAPRRTVRWYDYVLSAAGIIFLYGFYIVWLFQSHFQDVYTLLHTAKGKTLIDAQALLLYLQLLGPLPAPFTNKLSLLHSYMQAFGWMQLLMVLLLIAGAVMAVALVVKPRRSEGEVVSEPTWIVRIRRWWLDLRQSPFRCGLLILLIWQIVPLLYLTRHDIVLRSHYFIMFMPGPFILIGLFLSWAFNWLRVRLNISPIIRIAFLALCAILVAAQFLASSGYIYDASHGRYVDTEIAGQYYNDLASLQTAMSQADQLAQQRHLNHVYISADLATQVAFLYLAGQMKTPTTVVDDTCLVVPGAQSGSAILLTAPRSHRLDQVTSYAHAIPTGTLPHPGGPPFHLYMLQPDLTSTQSGDNFTQELKFMDIKPFHNGQRDVLASRWQMLRSAPAGYRTSYNYTIQSSATGTTTATGSHTCSVSAMRAGDQLIVPMGDPAHPPTRMQVVAFATLPTILSYNLLGAIPLQLDTFHQYDTPKKMLQSRSGLDYIPVTVPKKS